MEGILILLIGLMGINNPDNAKNSGGNLSDKERSSSELQIKTEFKLKKDQKLFQTSLEKKNELCRRWKLKSRYCRCRTIKVPEYRKIRLEATERFYSSFGQVKNVERSMRKSAWLPKISGEWSRYNDVDRALSSESGLYGWDQAVGVRQSWKVKVDWEPALLIFDPREINLLNEKRRHSLQLESTLDRVRRNFFDWKYKLLMFMRHPSLRKHFELEELEEMLNLYTNSRFSNMLRCYE